MLAADQITVVVDDGTVTLRGAVDTWHERRAASRHAYQGGARRVINELDLLSRRSTPLGLRATLVPNQVEYELDANHRGEDFRQFLKLAEPVRDPSRLPPAPEVDLVFRLRNEGERTIDVRLGHDKGGIELSLTGEGAVHVQLARSFLADFRPGRVVTIEPGKGFEIPIRSLQYGFRNASDRWYWTQAGNHMLQATLTWPASVTGIRMNAVAATPIKLTVVDPEEQE
jgi:hypothetical protein